MKMGQLLQGVAYEAPASVSLETEIPEICYDSRKVTKGSIFICISGTGSDGHDFVEMAREKGAAFILSERKDISGEDVFYSSNTRLALSQMADNFYGNPSKKLQMIGITGTNGKTTVTYLIKQMLEGIGHKVGLIGTIQNMIGDEVLESHYTTPEPLTLYQMLRKMADAKCDYVVMEVSSHSLAQDRVGALHFKVGVFTNLTQDHLDFHGTMENYLEAKAKLFAMCDIGVLNYDDEATKKIMESSTSQNITYSALSDYADITAKNIRLHARGVNFDLAAKHEIARIALGIPGKFSVYNALAAIGTGISLGIPAGQLALALASAKGVKGRAEVVPGTEGFTLLIDYAHTPDGLFNILSTVKGFAEGRVVAVFGCGGDRDRTKRPKMGKIGVDLADFCVITSDNPRSEEPDAIIADILEGVKGTNTPYEVVTSRAEAIRYAIEHVKPHDVIVLAGKGHETYQILKEGTIHFDEREVVAEILANLKK